MPSPVASGKLPHELFSALSITWPVSVTFTSLDELNGDRVVYWIKRSIPVWSPAGSRTD